MKIALDAGHGLTMKKTGSGENCSNITSVYSGASANGLVEDVLALDMIKRIGHHLRDSKIETVLTRPSENIVSLDIRAKIARANKCSVFLSIHFNAGPISANGIEAFVVENDLQSKKLAEQLLGAISKIGFKNRGAKWDSKSQHSKLSVLRNTHKNIPAVLLELGFITSPHDSSLIKDKFSRESIAIAIADTLKNQIS